MTKTPAQDKRHILKNSFVSSPRSEEILELIRQFRGKIPMTKIYEKVKALDPNVSGYTVFCKFIKNMEYAKQKKTQWLLADLQSGLSEVNEENKTKIVKEILDSALNNLFLMGDAVIKNELEEMKKAITDGTPLSEKQKERVMGWFFKGAKAHTDRRAVELKAKEGDREQRVIDNLLEALQYQKLDKADIVEGEIIKDGPA